VIILKEEYFSLGNLARGAVLELFDEEVRKVLENIQDVNTDPEKARKMTISVTIKPNHKRDEANISVQTKLALAPTNSIDSRLYIGKDNKGNVVAAEMQKGVLLGQHGIDMDTGEIVENNKIFKVK
jgi:hypothetical protein